mmetsp:Transcript_30694/g.74352  ORF Transcript_30694/g.74352 Transcript_30694/m.74352 type:complete len:485 (+) Transcript_30694:298-1752(+)
MKTIYQRVHKELRSENDTTASKKTVYNLVLVLAVISIVKLKFSSFVSVNRFLVKNDWSSSVDFVGKILVSTTTNSTTRSTSTTNSGGQLQNNQQQQSSSSSSQTTTTTIIDFISVGSNTRHHYLDAQRESFHALSHWAAASSPSTNWTVRKIMTYTENDDSERHCSTNLTTRQVMQVSKFCRGRRTASFSWKMNRMIQFFAHSQFLSKKGDDMIGWLCAQKRLPESFANGLKSYNNRNHDDLPDYLILIDDDTFINLPLMVPQLLKSYPKSQSYTVAGCLVASNVHGFPWGGFGAIITKTAIQRLLQPLYCNFDDNSTAAKVHQLPPNVATQRHRDLTLHEFETLACNRIESNLIGERSVYETGMNLADLLQAYISRWNYTSVETWGSQPNDLPGLCLHSDWIIGVWLNTFFVGRAYGGSGITDKDEDRIHPYLQSDLARQGPNSQCGFDSDEKCTNTTHICHHVSSQKMLEMSSRIRNSARST